MSVRSDGCAEYRGLSRRGFLGGALAGAGSLAIGPGWFPRLALAPPGGSGGHDVLVYLFLRGGLDGLSFVPPYADDGYYAARPLLAVPPPGAVGGALDLDGFFGLLPAAAPLQPLFAEGRLAILNAVSIQDYIDSHFEAFKTLEFGASFMPPGSLTDGWLARHLQLSTPPVAGPLRAAALTDTVPLTLQGAPLALPVADPAGFTFPGDPATAAARKAALTSMYAGVPAPLGPSAQDTLGAIELLSAVDFAAPAQHGAVYPDTDLGHALKACATIVRERLPIEVLMIDVPGYDLHSAQGPLDGNLATLADDLARSLAAFDADLGMLDLQRVTLLAHSEFGRRVAENASAGTDHGRGGVLLALGGHVLGGKVHGKWPGTSPEQLEKGNLAVTTDVRTVLAEVLVKRCGALAENLELIFPGHLQPFPGLIG